MSALVEIIWPNPVVSAHSPGALNRLVTPLCKHPLASSTLHSPGIPPTLPGDPFAGSCSCQCLCPFPLCPHSPTPAPHTFSPVLPHVYQWHHPSHHWVQISGFIQPGTHSAGPNGSVFKLCPNCEHSSPPLAPPHCPGHPHHLITHLLASSLPFYDPLSSYQRVTVEPKSDHVLPTPNSPGALPRHPDSSNS